MRLSKAASKCGGVCLRWGHLALGTDCQKLLLDPICFIAKPDFTTKVPQMRISGDGVKPDALIQLAQVHRAQVHGLGVFLRQVVGAVHHAAKIDAVVDPEHVPRFVRQHLAAATQHEPEAVSRVFSTETGIVAGKAVDAYPVIERGFAENKVPLGAGVEVAQCNPQEAVSPAREALLEQLKNILRE